jgi:hypothetical protein
MASDDRHSEALEAELIADPEEKAHREAKNVLRQFDSAIEQIEFWTQPEKTFKLRPPAIIALHPCGSRSLALGRRKLFMPRGRCAAWL